MANLEQCPLCGELSELSETSNGPMCSECFNFELENFPLAPVLEDYYD